MVKTLYDADGNPVDKTRLVEEVAAPTVTGVRQILSGHPAQNLTPQRLTALLLAAEQGDALAYLSLPRRWKRKTCIIGQSYPPESSKLPGFP